VGHIKNILSEGRVLMSLHGEEERVVELAAPLQEVELSIGDPLLFDARSGYALERLPKSDVEDMILEEVPDAAYEDIGGLGEQIETVRDAVELPFLHPELFAEHRLSPPKGVLLYGPPGCGKTLIAKAVAASLSKKLGHRDGKEIRSFFLHVKGPELLNKYVGETERKIREIFKKARERAEEGHPVIIFFDEMDALFRTRGTGVSSDMESTVVPQFLAEIDGLEALRNVIVIGASNRQDLLDPAMLRAGRLDVKIRIDRPDRQGAVDIFQKYLSIDLPYDEALLRDAEGDRRRAVDHLIADAVEEMYGTKDENKFLEVSYANGETEVLYFKDFSSGAMVSGIVSRAKKYAIKRTIETGVRGIALSDIIQAIRDEYRENEDLPNTTNPDDWAKIAGRRGDKIVHVRTIAGSDQKDKAKIEAVPTGHYL
jgi:proteasome-associated ATPase